MLNIPWSTHKYIHNLQINTWATLYKRKLWVKAKQNLMVEKPSWFGKGSAELFLAATKNVMIANINANNRIGQLNEEEEEDDEEENIIRRKNRNRCLQH